MKNVSEIIQEANDRNIILCGVDLATQKVWTGVPNFILQAKDISGPLLDRIDIHMTVPHVEYEKLTGDRLGEQSEMIRARVEKARGRQRKRFARTGGANGRSPLQVNADMRPAEGGFVSAADGCEGVPHTPWPLRSRRLRCKCL